MNVVQYYLSYLEMAYLEKIRFGVICALIIICATPALSIATEIEDLYEVEIPVTGQDEGERVNAIRTALKEVLIKVSGTRAVVSNPQLQPLLTKPMRFVQQFRYSEILSPPDDDQAMEQQDKVPSSGQPPEDGETEGLESAFTHIFWASFDPAAVNQALLDAGLPVWGHARPATLIWLAVEDSAQRFLVGGDAYLPIQEMLMESAKRRGLPLYFPLLDLSDRNNLRFTDIWGNFKDAIISASRRYQTEAVLVGRVYRESGDLWQSRWTLYHGDTSDQWVTEVVPQTDVLAAGIDVAADQLASRFARVYTEGSSEEVRLTITEVKSLEDYARVMAYLESLDPVTELQVEQVAGSEVVCSLNIHGSDAGLKRTISFGSTLAYLPPQNEIFLVNGVEDQAPESSEESTTPVLRYRLLP